MNKAMLKENRIHGDPFYPVRVYEYSSRNGQPLMDLHWHDELEFLMVTEGSAVFRINVNDYELKAGEAFFVNTGELHSGYTDAPDGCSFKALVFHPTILGGGQFDLVQEKYIQPLLHKKHAIPVRLTADTAPERDILHMLMQAFELNLTAAPLYELSTKGLLQMLMAKLILFGGPSFSEPMIPANHMKIERLKTILEYIHANSGKPIRLKDMAALVSISEAYFCRFFKQYTGKSPLDYINQVRMQQAASLLIDTNHKIMEIALDVGFSNLSYFIGVFKICFGCTPSEYRKRAAG